MLAGGMLASRMLASGCSKHRGRSVVQRLTTGAAAGRSWEESRDVLPTASRNSPTELRSRYRGPGARRGRRSGRAGHEPIPCHGCERFRSLPHTCRGGRLREGYDTGITKQRAAELAAVNKRTIPGSNHLTSAFARIALAGQVSETKGRANQWMLRRCKYEYVTFQKQEPANIRSGPLQKVITHRSHTPGGFIINGVSRWESPRPLPAARPAGAELKECKSTP